MHHECRYHRHRHRCRLQPGADQHHQWHKPVFQRTRTECFRQCQRQPDRRLGAAGCHQLLADQCAPGPAGNTHRDLPQRQPDHNPDRGCVHTEQHQGVWQWRRLAGGQQRECQRCLRRRNSQRGQCQPGLCDCQRHHCARRKLCRDHHLHRHACRQRHARNLYSQHCAECGGQRSGRKQPGCLAQRHDLRPTDDQQIALTDKPGPRQPGALHDPGEQLFRWCADWRADHRQPADWHVRPCQPGTKHEW